MYDASEYTQALLHLLASSASLWVYMDHICTDIKNDEEVTSEIWANIIVDTVQITW